MDLRVEWQNALRSAQTCAQSCLSASWHGCAVLFRVVNKRYTGEKEAAKTSLFERAFFSFLTPIEMDTEGTTVYKRQKRKQRRKS